MVRMRCHVFILSAYLIFCMSAFLLMFRYNHVNLPFESKKWNKLEFRERVHVNNKMSSNIEKNLDITRMKIKNELKNYDFMKSGVQKLEDLILEKSGNPVRTLIVSSWRSGSTFFGEILNAIPGNFYHYEPLLKYRINQIRGPPHAAQATSMLINMFHCNYSGMEEYFEYGKQHLHYLNLFEHNTRLWDQCKHNIELCFDANFSTKMCKLFPFQSMKLVRLRLHLVDVILNDKSLNVKVVLLIRDPRGVMQSRQFRNYCRPAPDCIDPKLVCSDMISDYFAARRLTRKYPGRIMPLRYEDLALNLNNTIEQVQHFLKLGPTQAVVEFLQTHTTFDIHEIDSTYRITQNVPFKWKKLLDYEYVKGIQGACKEAMQLWGYRLALNASHMTSEDFFPIIPYTIFQNEYKFYNVHK